MATTPDQAFFDRADKVIDLANAQLDDESKGRVSASLLYAAARFNAWVSARGFYEGSEMAEKKEETIDYFVAQYRNMLCENMDDYIENFAKYMTPPSK